MSRGIYHGIAGLQRDDFVLYKDHRGRWRVDLITSAGGTHVTLGKAEGEASKVGALKLAEREAHKRGFFDSVMYVSSGSGFTQIGNVTYGKFRAGGRVSRSPNNETRRAQAREQLRFVIGTLAHNRAFTKKEVAEYSQGRFTSKDVERLIRLGKLSRVEGGYYPTPEGWRWIEGRPPLPERDPRRSARRSARSPISRPVAKRTFYSGELVLVVRLLEGHHEHPGKRERQVKHCKHNAVYRVEIRPRTRGAHDVAKEWVCPPAHLSKALDSRESLQSAARAALSFAEDKGWPVDVHAAFNLRGTGWHVGTTKEGAWP